MDAIVDNEETNSQIGEKTLDQDIENILDRPDVEQLEETPDIKPKDDDIKLNEQTESIPNIQGSVHEGSDLVNDTANVPINEPIIEPINEHIIEPIIKPIIEPIIEPIDEPINEPINETLKEKNVGLENISLENVNVGEIEFDRYPKESRDTVTSNPESAAKALRSDSEHMPPKFPYFTKSDKDLYAKSYEESIFAQENPEGQDILNDLFEKNISKLLNDEGSIFSRSDKEIITLSDDNSDRFFKRLEIIEKIKDAKEQKKSLTTNNHFFQAKLLEYFRMMKVKQNTTLKQPSSEKESLMDFNTQYLRYSEIVFALMKDLDESMAVSDEKISRMRSICTGKDDDVNVSTKEFQKYEENIGLSAVHSRTGIKLDPSIISDYLMTESRKELAIKDVRLNNLKIEHKNISLDKSLRSKEDFEGGLRLIDFEQLKIENQTFNEKVEEREEAINKLNMKITKCNHLLSHIKEKIDVTDKIKKSSRIQSKVLDRDFKKIQKANNKSKKNRDNIKTNNRNLHLSCGLLGKKEYLRCYENVNDDTEKLKIKVARMEKEKRNICRTNRKLIQEIKENNHS